MNDNVIDQEKIKKIYQNCFVSPSNLSLNDPQLLYLLNYFPEDKNIHILDAGCGDGRYSDYLKKKGYVNICAVDLFERCSNMAVEYQTASVDALPFVDNSVDFIFSNSVIYYVEPPIKALIEFNRILKSNGILMITAHTKWSLFTFLRVIKRDLLNRSNMSYLSGVKFYSANYYQDALLASNFEVLLRDGWRFSFFLYPTYRLIASVLKKFSGIKFPEKSAYITKNPILGKIKSEISYHSVFIAKKK